MAPDWDPKWWMQYNLTKWWIPFKSQSQNVVSPNTSDSSGSTPGSASGPTTAAGFTTETSSSVFSHTWNITLINATDTNTTPHQTTNASVVTQMMTQNTPVPVPYVSPGPHLVEYPYEYRFIINEPKKCEQQQPFLVLIVPVAAHNRAHRDIIRSTWGGESLVLDKVVTLFFLLGLHTGEGAEQLQEQLLQESKEHQDLIQSDFLDCYKNLTIKTMVMLEWLDAHCSSASYAMKIDSDMFLNVPNLISMLSNAPKTNYMSGLVARGGAVLRDPNSKWLVVVKRSFQLVPNSRINKCGGIDQVSRPGASIHFQSCKILPVSPDLKQTPPPTQFLRFRPERVLRLLQHAGHREERSRGSRRNGGCREKDCVDKKTKSLRPANDLRQESVTARNSP
ncbi:beta-1,3-galactosyltransferase 2-like [Siniperca chuatsi]|uniref:beta-1,3-galactosyltransferase 2-like n=1 Tax=Siniperca chuatsi TaxID=119488 RepID=UPI001CE12791|nr:beta-1,3-galactosyltransferase 2-like [Siniperca chuatsi]